MVDMAALCHDRKIVFGSVTLNEVTPYAFSGLVDMKLDLRNLGIQRVHPNAFGGTTNLSIDLRGNNIVQMSHTSFPGESVRGDVCIDHHDFEISFNYREYVDRSSRHKYDNCAYVPCALLQEWFDV